MRAHYLNSTLAFQIFWTLTKLILPLYNYAFSLNNSQIVGGVRSGPQQPKMDLNKKFLPTPQTMINIGWSDTNLCFTYSLCYFASLQYK